MTLDECGEVVSRADVLAIFQYRSLSALYRAIDAGTFPAPDLSYPARWSRDRLQAWWRTGRRVTDKLRSIA